MAEKRLARAAPVDPPRPRCYVPLPPPGSCGNAGRDVIATNDRRGGRRDWLPPLVWAALVLTASSLQELQTGHGALALRDKFAHFGEYFVFGWLVARALGGRGWGSGKHFVWTALIGLWLGCLDEFYQGFVPGRERDVLDLLADVVGTVAGWYFSREDRAVEDSHGAAGHA
jgi:VanZ family protein